MVFIGIVKAISEHEHKGAAEVVPLGTPDNWQWKLIASSGVFKPVCFQLGHCPFNADFDRGCTIRPRVEAGQFDEIKPEEYMADPTAGWVR
jgi:hypothetical protein